MTQAIKQANWIRSTIGGTDEGMLFQKRFSAEKPLQSAELEISALGVYVAQLNGQRVGDFILAPGWTSYANRVQLQRYDVSAMLQKENCLAITLGKGWRFLSRPHEAAALLGYQDTAIIAALKLSYADGSEETIVTDDSWSVERSPVVYNNIYNGEHFDATLPPQQAQQAQIVAHDTDILTAQQGESITEHERLPAQELIRTPAGETVIDFGQNLTGYVEFTIQGKPGDKAVIKHAEVLDQDGNLYTENYRRAKAELSFTCDGKPHTYKPLLTFFGFRYIKLIGWPDEVKLEHFTAIAVHSQMKRTGEFCCSDPMLNQLFHNIIWGQKGNFLDVPTDCPQRDERLGWTGDAQVFVRTASYNYDVNRFFKKWLTDLRLDQNEDGSVPHVIPNAIGGGGSAAWSDAAVICPWQMYLSYADKEILQAQFASMRSWIAYMQQNSRGYLWVKGDHFGDWLALDNKKRRPGTDKKLIASAYFYYSTSLFVKAGQVLGKNMEEYELLRENIGAAFRKRYMKAGRMKQPSQTACCVALYFGLTDDAQETAAQLAELVREVGHLTTGFVGTPYLLHALSDNGYAEDAYNLLLRKEYPSWLYPITMGATTIWERWDSMRPDGSMQDPGMTSFNHYAYGAVGDWLYGVVAGINPSPQAPGFAHTEFRPLPDRRLQFAKASIETRHGLLESGWEYQGDSIVFRVTVPQGCTAEFHYGGAVQQLKGGTHTITKQA